MRIVPGVLLDGVGGPAVGVALPQNRVHRAALDLVVARPDRLRFIVNWIVGIEWQRVTLRLELGNGGFQLR